MSNRSLPANPESLRNCRSKTSRIKPSTTPTATSTTFINSEVTFRICYCNGDAKRIRAVSDSFIRIGSGWQLCGSSTKIDVPSTLVEHRSDFGQLPPLRHPVDDSGNAAKFSFRDCEAGPVGAEV